MIKTQAQALAHELTLEYIHVHPELLTGNIEDITDRIADINKEFYEAICKSDKLSSLYS